MNKKFNQNVFIKQPQVNLNRATFPFQNTNTPSVQTPAALYPQFNFQNEFALYQPKLHNNQAAVQHQHQIAIQQGFHTPTVISKPIVTPSIQVRKSFSL